MKSFYDQKYKTIINVRVTYAFQNDSWIDAIKGLNTGHALHLAKLNWPGAIITIIN